MVYEFSFYSDNKKIKRDRKLVFLRKTFDRRNQEYYDWMFATGVEELISIPSQLNTRKDGESRRCLGYRTSAESRQNKDD